MFQLRLLLCIFVIFLPIDLAGAQQLSGDWSGTAQQSGPGDQRSQWHARMVLNGSTGQMDYPSLGCGGPLTFVNKNGNIWFYRERITYGADKCIDGGMIAVEPSGDSIQWAWNGSGATATAVLNGRRNWQSCNECDVQRSRCHTGCGPSGIACVNRCNSEYQCVMGYDCR